MSSAVKPSPQRERYLSGRFTKGQRKQFYATVKLGGYGAIAIELYFVDPLGAVEKLRHGQAFHGFNERGWAKRKRAELLV